MAGWLIDVTYKGNEPDTLPRNQAWAAWVPDQVQAIADVIGASGGEYSGNIRSLSEMQLRNLGADPGKIVECPHPF